MTRWNFDISTIPRGRTETRQRVSIVKGVETVTEYEHFIPETIWAETAHGEVIRTIFNQPTKQTPAGWWSGIGKEELIVAWQPLIRPEPSGIGRRDSVGPGEVHLPILEDAGGGV